LAQLIAINTIKVSNMSHPETGEPRQFSRFGMSLRKRKNAPMSKEAKRFERCSWKSWFSSSFGDELVRWRRKKAAGETPSPEKVGEEEMDGLGPCHLA